MRVFVTGGTGCVGSHVIDRLIADGHTALALVRKSSDTRHLREVGAELVIGDVTDRASLEAALVGKNVDAVVHSAAVVTASGDWSHYEQVGVHGTQHVIDAMRAAGVQRLLHVSSIAAYGMGDLRGLREDQPLADDGPTWNHYVREKAAAEKIVWAAHNAGQIGATVLRPAVIVGTRDRNVAPGLLANMAHKRGSLVGSGENRVAFVVVQDVADAVVRALQTPASNGRAYNLASPEPRTQLELYRLYSQATGLPVPAARTPRRVAVFFSRAVNGMHRLLRRPGNPPMDPIGAMIWGSDAVVDSTRAATELGWKAQSDLQQSVQDWVAWRSVSTGDR